MGASVCCCMHHGAGTNINFCKVSLKSSRVVHAAPLYIHFLKMSLMWLKNDKYALILVQFYIATILLYGKILPELSTLAHADVLFFYVAIACMQAIAIAIHLMHWCIAIVN